MALGAGGSQALLYDQAGNVIFDNRTSGGNGYTYDAAGRMVSFSINGALQAEYRYNPLGQQITRRLVPSGVTIHSNYGPDGNRIAEYDEASGALIREYAWLNGAPLVVREGGVNYFIRTDHIGRPVFATNAGGVKVWTAAYLPFGGVRTSTGTPITLRFPGQWFQSESGLYQNWMRDYDPATGRYLQADPLGLVDGASVYGYVRGNPGRWTDPTGLCLPWCIPIVIGAIEWIGGGAAISSSGASALGVGIGVGILTMGGATGTGDGTVPPSSVPKLEIEQCTADQGDCTPANSPQWQKFSPYSGKTKTNALPGKAREYYQWDYTHCNIEVYNRRGKHVGVMDPQTGTMIGPGVPGRSIRI